MYVNPLNLNNKYLFGQEKANVLVRIVCLAFLFLAATPTLCAQGKNAPEATVNKDSLTFKQRFNFRTNAVDWLLTIPNFAVEFDLGNNVRSKRTIGAGIKWNWNTSHTMSPPTVFNLFDARVEWRQYFRTRQRQGSGDDKDFFKRLRNKVFTTKRKHPRTRRAYFWGIYAHTMNYNLKLGKEGRQGTAYGAGVSLGYTAPLYGYANGAVDIELGGSLGLIHHSYDVYTHDDESNIYAFDPSKSGSGILPIISDVRVAFVYRFMSVENKYKQTRDGERRYDRWEAKQIELKEIENKARFRLDSLFSVEKKKGVTNIDSLLNKDDLKLWRKMQEEKKLQQQKEAYEKMRKDAAKKLGIELTDSTSAKQLRAVEQEVKKMKEAAEEAAKAKDPEKVKKDAEKAQKKAEKEAKKSKKEKKPKKEKKSKKDKDKAKDEEVNPEAEATAKEPDEEVETTNEEEGES